MCFRQCCGAATSLGGSGSPRSRSRIRTKWVGSGSRQNKAAPASNTKFCHFQLFKKFIINASRPWIIFTSVMDPDPYSECGSIHVNIG